MNNEQRFRDMLRPYYYGWKREHIDEHGQRWILYFTMAGPEGACMVLVARGLNREESLLQESLT